MYRYQSHMRGVLSSQVGDNITVFMLRQNVSSTLESHSGSANSLGCQVFFNTSEIIWDRITIPVVIIENISEAN